MKKINNSGFRMMLTCAVAVMALAFTGQAFAITYPAECSTTRDKTAFKMGHDYMGKSMARSAWASVDKDPDQVEAFQAAILDAAGTINSYIRPGNSNYVNCRIKGMYAGLLNELYVIQTNAFIQCLFDGLFVGEMVGQLYCDMAIEFDGVGMDVDFIRVDTDWICDDAFEFACDYKFKYDTKRFCYDYTIGDEFEPWDQWRNNQCAYAPELP